MSVFRRLSCSWLNKRLIGSRLNSNKYRQISSDMFDATARNCMHLERIKGIKCYFMKSMAPMQVCYLCSLHVFIVVFGGQEKTFVLMMQHFQLILRGQYITIGHFNVLLIFTKKNMSKNKPEQNILGALPNYIKFLEYFMEKESLFKLVTFSLMKLIPKKLPYKMTKP